ncbi:hypothetical protein KR50_24010 [Jeotgalibacillus campisalis]|uniref:Uncharacterized protein n=1 Tax=Jeotgalibacillus campisalis TaxID=220754 RepID=A0A0C2RZ65_9BACL|nr:hypothetical protein KR50_24010 [Jeotgalibacillus campisalis]
MATPAGCDGKLRPRKAKPGGGSSAVPAESGRLKRSEPV